MDKEVYEVNELIEKIENNNKEELERIFSKLMNDEDFYKKASQTCHTYVSQKVGATEIIMRTIKL